MDAINKYYESIFFLIIGLIPSCVGLLLFDHSMLSKSDILMTTGMWFWAGICVLYTACFILFYSISIPLIHPMVWVYLKIEKTNDDDDWKAIILHLFLWSIVSGLITWFKNGNFLHFIGNSFIVCISVNVVLLLSYMILKREEKKQV